MRIRSITIFFSPQEKNLSKQLERLGKLRDAAILAFQNAGYEIETTRLATIPFPTLVDTTQPGTAASLAKSLEAQIPAYGFTYLSLGPALPEIPSSYQRTVEILQETQNVFCTAISGNNIHGLNMPAIKACGEAIKAIANLSANGFDNLRFSVLANVLPFTPYFPAAYHEGFEPAFGLAVESADCAIAAFEQSATLNEARRRLLDVLENNGARLKTIAQAISRVFDVPFKGIDFSLAPFPEDWCSLGGAIERLGDFRMGEIGSLAAAAWVADTLDCGQWLKTGYNGLMLPVLEDTVLALRAEQGILNVKDLLIYSAVCGTGLDTVPLPGDVTPQQLSALLMDLTSLALRLDKPLTARLMPIPGKKAGEMTDFQFDFFANGGILPLPAQPLQKLMAGNETYMLGPHPRQKKRV